ncbi:probable RNA-binding protein EIF1AD [Stomoxys calcitrans]|uniref:Probable RNA-binding protein EIF1AD n=1 Tax=Stomoxys calcitrans TaxID=35570 RepID=A0A1I8NXV7_STOCA|nr:probable RNA-binding protein EIF1AD [Stomoxys calcitrans]
MSRVTRQKHVLKEMMEDDYELPKENQQIVRVVCSRGNNLHEVETANVGEDRFLVTMPNKFRKNLWVKRGDFIVVEPIEEGDKVKAEICKILTTEHIKEYSKAGVWPERFIKKSNNEHCPINGTYSNREAPSNGNSSNDDDDDDDDDLEPNTNRPVARIIDDSDDSDDDDSSSEEDES